MHTKRQWLKNLQPNDQSNSMPHQHEETGFPMLLPVLIRLKVSTGCRTLVGEKVTAKVQLPVKVVMLLTARSHATDVVAIMIRNANTLMKSVTGVKNIGHIARMCRAKQRSQGKNNVAHVSDGDEPTEDHTLGLFGIYSANADMNGVSGCKAIKVNVTLGNEIVPMQLDTGAAVSIISENTYSRVLQKYPLQTSSITLKSYTGDLIPIAGKADIPVTYGEQHFTLPVVVACGERAALLGRDWMQQIKLDWKSIFSVMSGATSDMHQLMGKYAHLFRNDGSTIQRHTETLKLKPEQNPVYQKVRPVPYALRELVENEIDRLESAGVLYRFDNSEWASPTENVPKMENGKMSVRVCGDYKLVNVTIEDDKYPLPTAQDLFANLAHKGKKPTVFSILDLSGAFNQLEVDEKSSPLLTRNTHKGLYRTRRLAYGVKTAPSVFQARMDKILAGIKNVMCFVNDILVTGNTEQEHLKTLEQVLQMLDQYNVRLNKAKCQFMKSQVQYLGHTVNANGIQSVQDKVEAIWKAPPPTNITELQSFLGVVQYYAKFVPNLSTVFHPLYERLKADVEWSWDSSCDEAFNQCKRLLSSETVLTTMEASHSFLPWMQARMESEL